MAELDPAVEQQLADLNDADWRALSARVRPPTSSQQLREMAAKHISGEQLETLMAITDPKKLANEIGDIDEATLTGHLTTLFGASDSQPQQPRRFGQHSSGGAPGKSPGDDGRAALEKRHGVKQTGDQPAPGAGIRPGEDARAELTKRYGGQKK